MRLKFPISPTHQSVVSALRSFLPYRLIGILEQLSPLQRGCLLVQLAGPVEAHNVCKREKCIFTCGQQRKAMRRSSSWPCRLGPNSVKNCDSEFRRQDVASVKAYAALVDSFTMEAFETISINTPLFPSGKSQWLDPPFATE